MTTEEFVDAVNAIGNKDEINAGLALKEVVFLKDGERLEEYRVSPPWVKGERNGYYEIIRSTSDSQFENFCFWQPGAIGLRIVRKYEVKKIEVISDDTNEN